MGIRETRLANDEARLRAMAQASGDRVVVLSATGRPPSDYLLEIRCRSVVRLEGGSPVFGTRHRLRVTLPPSYPGPAMAPRAELLTPIFHPHVFTNGVVCVGTRHRVSEFLDLFVTRVGEILRLSPDYLDPASPANPLAMEWALANRAGLPLDSEPFGATTPVTRSAMTWCELR